MVAREDLRPTRPDDSLKRFINGIKNGKTVPVGLKVAQPNEGYIFYDSTETAHPWNGDTIQVVNDRLAEAQQIMAETRANLEQTRLDLDAAKDRIQASTGDLSVYDARIQAAEQQVASTAAELDTVQDTLTTTSTDLAGLESRTGSVESALAQVHQDTVAAQVAAGNAQKSADGKTTTQYGTVTPPPNPGATKGDTYYYTGTDNRIIETWQWSGTAWVKRKIESAQLANFDAGYITSGYLDVAKRIQAGSIFADKLTIGIGDNIMPPVVPTANMPGVPASAVVAGGIGSSYAVKVPASASSAGYYLASPTAGDYLLTATPFTQYRVSVYAKSATPATAALYVRFVDSSTGTWSFGTPSAVSASVGTSWTLVSGTVTPPNDGKAYDRIYLGLCAVLSHDSDVYFSAPSLREMKDGSLIVNGTITGDKVNAQSVAGAVGQFVKVQATNVEVTGELASRVAQFMDASAKKLVVSEEAILQHTTLLGTTVANQLNVRGLLRGRDAILTGTVDITQLNVTETMAAEIARFMSVETKRAVVSEDAILQRATVIENIVTPELIANKANIDVLGSRLITSGTLQTSTAPNAGVKITSEGYKAFDAAGNLAVNLDGRNNLMVGSFATSTQASSGVKISQGSTIAAIDLYTPNWGGNVTTQNSHGGIWFEVPSALSKRGLNIFATDNAYVGSADPGIMLRPGYSGIEFQGRFAGTGSAMKVGMQTGVSVAKDGWWTMKVTFPSPMQTDPAVFISPVTANNVECSIGIMNATRFGFEAVVVNKSLRDSGTAWLKWIAFSI